MLVMVFFFIFFFQAEDGIRDVAVTGVQTCALPILGHGGRTPAPGPGPRAGHASGRAMSPRSPRLIDLSHTIEHGMVTYKGLPAPVIGDWLSRDASSARYAPGTTFQIGKIGMLANTGTYIDAPF